MPIASNIYVAIAYAQAITVLFRKTGCFVYLEVSQMITSTHGCDTGKDEQHEPHCTLKDKIEFDY